jgi:hypothetical protein
MSESISIDVGPVHESTGVMLVRNQENDAQEYFVLTNISQLL